MRDGYSKLMMVEGNYKAVVPTKLYSSSIFDDTEGHFKFQHGFTAKLHKEATDIVNDTRAVREAVKEQGVVELEDYVIMSDLLRIQEEEMAAIRRNM